MFPDTGAVMPVLFVGHGSPMNAIEETGFSRAWVRIGRSLPRPKAILCVSAHWETAGTRVTAMPRPRTIHDFHGFPRPLYEVLYPAEGSPGLARLVSDAVRATPVHLDGEWGLDHGSWSVLRRMYPNADIPVVQLSLDRTKGAAFHYELGRELKGLRKRGVLIVGSGNIVHNLRLMVPEDVAFDWASEYDSRVKEWILAGDHRAIVDYPKHGEIARLSIPTNEHYLPLLYVLAMREEGEPVEFFAEKVTLGSISMRSLRVG